MVINKIVKNYFTVILISILIVISFGFINLDSVGNYLFPFGDVNFYIVNLENGDTEKKIVSLNEQFITGSTYFINNQTQYFGYIQAIEINHGEYLSSLNVINLSNSSELYETTLPFFEYSNFGSVIYKGMTVHYLNNQPIFSAILDRGTTQSNTITSITQFSINGTILDTIDYNVTNYPFAKLHDISSIDHTKYKVLTSLEESEILDLGASHILTYDYQENESDILHLERKAQSLTYDRATDSIFTSAENSKIINHLNSKGELLKPINVNFELSEIDLINSSHLIFRVDKENQQHLYYAAGVMIVIFLIIPVLLQRKFK